MLRGSNPSRGKIFSLPASYSLGTEVISGGKRPRREVDHSSLAPILRMSEAVPLVPLCAFAE